MLIAPPPPQKNLAGGGDPASIEKENWIRTLIKGGMGESLTGFVLLIYNHAESMPGRLYFIYRVLLIGYPRHGPDGFAAPVQKFIRLASRMGNYSKLLINYGLKNYASLAKNIFDKR